MTGTVKNNSIVWIDKINSQWDNLPWEKIKNFVYKLQKRIYKASLSGDNTKTKQLQKILLKSWYAKCWAVQNVVKSYSRKKLYDLNLWELAENLFKNNSSHPICDRVAQELIAMTIPCQPRLSNNRAISKIKSSINNQYHYFLQLKIDDDHCQANSEIILAKINNISWIKKCLRKILNQSLLSKKILTNIIFSDLEKYLRTQANSDLELSQCGSEIIIWHQDKQVIENYAEKITQIVKKISQKVEIKINYCQAEFAGFKIKQYPKNNKLVVVIEPSKNNVKKHYQNIAECIKRNKTATQAELIKMLNTKINKWLKQCSCVNSKGFFRKMDCLIWSKLKRWCKRRHSNQKAVKIQGKYQPYWVHKYWHQIGKNRWVFSDAESNNMLRKYSNRGTCKSS